MSITSQSLGIQVHLQADFESALQRTVEALKAEGFGVLTEIDVKDTLKKKINADFRPYKILGACNPSLAYRALQADANVGLLLPCNVTVQAGEPGETLVSLVDPITMLSVLPNSELEAVANEARTRLERVAKVLEA